MASSTPAISFVIPVYNEEESLPELTLRIREEMDQLGKSFEIIFVDDGSDDRTPEVLETLFRKSPEVKTIRLRRNEGKAAALSVGFSHAQGDLIFTLDADLQDDPREIPRFIAKTEEGFDLVSGWKETRHDPLSKTLPSKIFNRVVAFFSGLELHDFNCGFKCYRKEVLPAIRLYGELHRFIPALAHSRGFRVAEIAVKHHPRQHGQSKYGWERIPRGFLDLLTVLMITRHSKTALHAFGTFGALMMGGAIVILLTLFIVPLITGELSQDTKVFVWLSVMLTVAGAQALLFGLLADTLSRSFPTGSRALIRRSLSHPEAARE